MPLKDVEARRSYEREQRRLERQELKEYREIKLNLKSCSNVNGKITALIASSAFSDLGKAIQLLGTT